jgi:hypothetical protein
MSLILFCLAAAPVAPAAPAAAEALVRRLGDESFAVRARSADELRDLGRQAIPALRRGLQDGDAEVRRRCGELLAYADRSDLDLRLDAFIEKGEDPKQPLACWARFRDLVGGDDRLTRAAFADLYRHDAALLESLDRGPLEDLNRALKKGPGLRDGSTPDSPQPDSVTGMLNARCARVQTRFGFGRRGGPVAVPTTEVMALALLAASLPAGGDLSAYYQFTNCLYLPGASSAVASDRLTRRLVSRALLQKSADPNMLNQASYMAQYLRLGELQEQLRPRAVRLVDDALKANGDLNQLAQAVNLASNLELKDLLDERLKPAVRKLAGEAAAHPADWNRMYQTFYMAQTLKMTDVLDEVLRPAARKTVRLLARGAARDVGKVPATDGPDRSREADDLGLRPIDRLYQAQQMVQVFQCNDLFESEVKPAVFVVVEAMAQKPEENGDFDQAMQLAQNTNAEQALDEILRPLAEQVVVRAAAKPDDPNLFNRAVYLAQCLTLHDAVEGHLKPILEKRARAIAGKVESLGEIAQLFQNAQTLNLGEPIGELLKPAVLKILKDRDKVLVAGQAPSLLQLIRGLKLKEGVDAALWAAQSKTVDAYNRGLAVCLVADLGSKEHVAHLEPLLSDATRIGQCGVNSSTLNCDLRDVALAALIVLDHREPADFDFLYPALTGQPFNADSFSCFGFENDSSREAAVKKWKASKK